MTPAQLAEIEARCYYHTTTASEFVRDIVALLAEVKRLRSLAGEAIDEAEHGWAYASEDFRGKCEADKTIAGLRAALGGEQ